MKARKNKGETGPTLKSSALGGLGRSPKLMGAGENNEGIRACCYSTVVERAKVQEKSRGTKSDGAGLVYRGLGGGTGCCRRGTKFVWLSWRGIRDFGGERRRSWKTGTPMALPKQFSQ